MSEEDTEKPLVSDEHILDGACYQIPDPMLKTVAGRQSPFLDYVAKRSDTGRTGTDNY